MQQIINKVQPECQIIFDYELYKKLQSDDDKVYARKLHLQNCNPDLREPLFQPTNKRFLQRANLEAYFVAHRLYLLSIKPFRFVPYSLPEYRRSNPLLFRGCVLKTLSGNKEKELECNEDFLSMLYSYLDAKDVTAFTLAREPKRPKP